MKNSVKLSVVIITFNEERNIKRCIESVKSIADEVVVVDSYSKDNTVAIAQSLGAKVVQHPFAGHIEQKNYAITQAAFPHILSLDADEMPDKIFLEQIGLVKQNWDADGYSINRLNNYCGQWIRHGAWYPDIKLRLWDSRKGKWAGTNPHDRYEMESGSIIKHLPGDLLHYSYQTIEEHQKKADYFSTIAAKAYFQKGKRSSLFKMVMSPIFRFVRDYIFKLGLLDGYHGWVIARTIASEVFMKYQKLRKLQND